MARLELPSLESAAVSSANVKGDIFFELGLLYATGRSVNYDPIEAHKWMNLAAMRGNSQAVRYRAEIAEELSSEGIAQAQKRAREWLTLH